jgi:lipoate-protein ligase A
MSVPFVPETKFGVPLAGGPREGIVRIDPPLSGETNMAIDEALLRDATPESPIVLRVYQWDQPTLSLGHFQSWEDCRTIPGLSDLPWVRRKTGGGAIVHDQEITYSILIPETRNKTSKGHSELFYRAIHGSVVENLRKLGWDAKLSETCTCSTATNQKEEPFLCFSRRSPVDLMIETNKILGSAQRRTSAGLLQHGSLLVLHSPTTPRLIGLSEITKRFPAKLGQEDFRVEPTLNYNKEMWESGLPDALFNSGFAPPVAKASFDRKAWADFLVGVLKSSLSEIVNCQWRQRNYDEGAVFKVGR